MGICYSVTGSALGGAAVGSYIGGCLCETSEIVADMGESESSEALEPTCDCQTAAVGATIGGVLGGLVRDITYEIVDNNRV